MVSEQFPKWTRSSSFVNFPQRTTIDLESKLKTCQVLLLDIVKRMAKPKPNLSRKEMTTLKTLKRKDLVYLPSDKGTEFCTISTTEYDRAAFEHLGDESSYQPISHMASSTIEDKINSTWSRVCVEAKLSTRIRKNLLTRNSTLPKFYHLIKTHKNSPEIKIRPIVSNVNGPTAKMAWLMATILQPLVHTVPAHLNNSLDLIEQISTIPDDIKKVYKYPFSLDVVALYPSIPPDQAIRNIEQKLENHQIPLYGLQREHISEILTTILGNTFFTYKLRTYKQISGLAMGSSVSAILAILFMDSVEKLALHNYNNFSLFRRYVDDCLLITVSKEEAEIILCKMNNINPHIKFEIEFPDQHNTLNLLDFSLNIDTTSGATTFNFYKKSAKRDVFPHFDSAIPLKQKQNIIANEVRRIKQRCTHKTDFLQHCCNLRNVLSTRGYPPRIIERATRTAESSEGRPTRTSRNNQKFFYLQLPFLDEHTTRLIRKLFKYQELPVRVYHKSYTLRRALKRNDPPRNCTIKDCRVNDPKLCFRQSVVYKLKCNACSAEYIGSTLRCLHTRIQEHNKNNGSSIFQHSQVCGGNYTISVLAKENDLVNLRIREGILIQKLKPSINSKTELCSNLNLIL